MAQWLKALAAFPEDPHLIPSTNTVAYHTVNSILGDLVPFSDLCRHQASTQCTDMRRDIKLQQTEKKSTSKFLRLIKSFYQHVMVQCTHAVCSDWSAQNSSLLVNHSLYAENRKHSALSSSSLSLTLVLLLSRMCSCLFSISLPD